MKFKITKKIIMGIVTGLIIVVIVIQFVTVERTNPPVTGEINVTPELKSVLQKSCYDCHSNETVWPWYSKVAPVSWLVSKDVVEGREELNFSEWDKYTEKKRAKKMKEIIEEIDNGDMPMTIYTFMHNNAVLTEKEKELIKNWANEFKAQDDSILNNNLD